MVTIAGMKVVEQSLPTSPVLVALSKVVSFIVLALVATAGAATLYRYAPSRDEPRWTWLTAGSILFALVWVSITIGFGFYVSHLGNYGATYGSLGAVVILLTWMYLSAYALLFGAELNSELEHQTARDTTRGEERPMGERGAWAADHVPSAQDEGTSASHR